MTEKFKLAIIGYPIGHTLSPVLYEAAFKELNLDYSYEVLSTPPEDLISQINEIQNSLKNSYSNMQLAQNCHLLDYYAYKIKSEEALHEFLIEQYKKIE